MTTPAQRLEIQTADELEDMVDRLDELEEWAAEEGYRALECKVQEARGSLFSAMHAMRQYAAGELTPRLEG